MALTQPRIDNPPGSPRGSAAGLGPQDPSLKTKRPKIARSVQSLFRDCILLADLQFQLLTVDLRQFWDAVKSQLILAGGMAVLALGSMSVLLLGLAHLLQEGLGLRSGVAELIVGGIATVGATAYLLSLSSLIKRAAEPLQRTQAELRENLNWLRETLKHEDD